MGLERASGFNADLTKRYNQAIGKQMAQDELLIVERPDASTSPTDLQGGQLAARRADGALVPFPLQHTEVRADIAVAVGSVRVRQQYHNPYAEKIEAIYVFPLPHDAAVRDFALTIGERRIRGIVREREEARHIYDEAKRQGYVASLLSQERPNVFTQSVANIEPGKSVDVDIAYFHTIPTIDAAHEFVFPMVVGPRYNPPGRADGIGAVAAGSPPGSSGQATTVAYLRPEQIDPHDISLEVAIEAGAPLGAIVSPSHAVEIERTGESRATVRLAAGDRIPNRDFVLRYTAGDARATSGALAFHEDETSGYLLLEILPPASLAEIPAPPREMVFVLDCSGSMDGEPLAHAKAVLRGCLERLRPGDTFQIVRFSDSASALGPAPVPATRESIALALSHLEGLRSEGGTNMIEGIRAALGFPHDPERYRIVSFLTDGFIGNEVDILAAVKQLLGPARIFSLGVGSSVNRHLLEALARLGSGVATYVLPGQTSLEPVEALYRRLEHPAMTDVRIDWGSLAVSEAYPERLPDVFAGKPVLVTARCARGESPRGAIRILGNVGGQPREVRVPFDAGVSRRHDALASLWARARIGALEDELIDSPYPAELAPRIRDVALRYGLASSFTSFVAVDSSVRTAGDHGTSVLVPVSLPQGVRYETTVSEGSR